MSARRRSHAQAGNLDSLLDTMANVTGILIVLLAVTQLSVSDAMARIRSELSERPELTAQSLAQAEEEASQLAATLASLEARRTELLRERGRAAEELATLRSENASPAVGLQFAGDLPALREALEKSERDEQHLADRVGEARREIAVLDQQLAAARHSSPREVVLPDPRPPPSGARQLPVFVRYGRVVPVDVSELIGRLQRGTRLASEGKWVFLDGPPNFVDRSQIVAYFQIHDIGTENFRWHVVNNGGRDFYAHLEWRDRKMGDSLETLLGERSLFKRELKRLRPSTHYLLFLVWEDSFEPYLLAREMAAEAGFASGWEPYGEHVPFRENLLRTQAHVTVD